MKSKKVRYQGPSRCSLRWPPMQELENLRGSRHVMQPGEPVVMRLRRFGGDKALRSHERSRCCACGYVHQHIYEVFRAADDRFYLSVRSYSDPETWPKKVVRR